MTESICGVRCGTCLNLELGRDSDTCRQCQRALTHLPNWTPRAAEVADIPAPPPNIKAPPSIKAHIADEAKRIVDGARRGAYGLPEDNFARIANFWTAYFENTGRGIHVTPQDVSPLMRLMKEARLCETPDHLDSHIDLVGYTLTGAEVNGVKIPD